MAERGWRDGAEVECQIKCKLCGLDMRQPARDGVGDCPQCGQGLTLARMQRIVSKLFRTKKVTVLRVD